MVCTPVFLPVQRLCSKQESGEPRSTLAGGLQLCQGAWRSVSGGPIGMRWMHARLCSRSNLIDPGYVCHADEPGEACQDGRVRPDRRQGLRSEVGWPALNSTASGMTCEDADLHQGMGASKQQTTTALNEPLSAAHAAGAAQYLHHGVNRIACATDSGDLHCVDVHVRSLQLIIGSRIAAVPLAGCTLPTPPTTIMQGCGLLPQKIPI